MTDILLVKKLSDNAIIPTKGSKHAAGWDLYSSESLTIPPHQKALIKTDISITTPLGTYGRIAPRSGLALKHFIDVGAGVADHDYSGPLGVLLFNFNDSPFIVNKGDRIAQLILEKYNDCCLKVVDELDSTERGDGGFGSTGK